MRCRMLWSPTTCSFATTRHPAAPNCGQPVVFQVFGPIAGFHADHNTVWDSLITLRGDGWSNVTMTNNVSQRIWSDSSSPFASDYRASNNLTRLAGCPDPTTITGTFPSTGWANVCAPAFVNPSVDDYRLPAGRVSTGFRRLSTTGRSNRRLRPRGSVDPSAEGSERRLPTGR